MTVALALPFAQTKIAEISDGATAYRMPRGRTPLRSWISLMAPLETAVSVAVDVYRPSGLAVTYANGKTIPLWTVDGMRP
jgi:hypothetical protein